MQERVHQVDWANHHPVDRAVLCFIRVDNSLLLIHKKRGLGKGKINAPGGRLEPGETPFAAAVRETEEEVGLTPSGLAHAGELSFIFTDGYSLSCSVITAEGYTGNPIETDEAVPFWCGETELPYHRMWTDDRLWIPLLLDEIPFRGFFIFRDDQMLDHLLRTGTEAALSRLDLAPLANQETTF